MRSGTGLESSGRGFCRIFTRKTGYQEVGQEVERGNNKFCKDGAGAGSELELVAAAEGVCEGRDVADRPGGKQDDDKRVRAIKQDAQGKRIRPALKGELVREQKREDGSQAGAEKIGRKDRNAGPTDENVQHGEIQKPAKTGDSTKAQKAGLPAGRL